METGSTLVQTQRRPDAIAARARPRAHVQRLRRVASVAVAATLAWALVAPTATVVAATAVRATPPAGRTPSLPRVTARPHPNLPRVPGVVLVGYRLGTSTSGQVMARRSVNATSAHRLSPLSGSSEKLTLPAGTSVDAAIAALEADPDVRFAEPDYLVSTDATSDDPFLLAPPPNNLWAMLAGPASPFGTGAVDSWAADVTGSPTVVVGIVDEGIQIDHPDLAANIWTNPWDPVNGIDDDGNGYVDDVHGWDFLHNDNTVDDGAANDGHGTHVAGTIGGVGGNGIGVVGVNWSVSMISAKFLEDTGDTANAIRALDYLTDLKVRHGLDIVATNNSWGGGAFSQALVDAINRGGDQNILFVAAAGNDHVNDDGANPFYPAANKCDKHYPNGAARGWDCIVSVAAIGKTGALADFSNYGATSVDLGAPGAGIVSTFPPSAYAIADGTSMAAPHVTGAIALAASCEYGRPANLLRSDVLTTATATAGLAGVTSTGRRLNIGALTAARCAPTAPPTALVTGPSGVGVGSTFDETVWFSHSITGLATDDFTVTGTSDGWGVTGVSGSGSGPYAVNLASGGPTDGTVILTLKPATVSDGTSTGPASAAVGPTVHIDRTPPGAAIAMPHSPTKAATLTANVIFSEPVTGLTAGDLTLGGTAAGCGIGTPAVLPDHVTWSVQISGCGEGTVGLTLGPGSVVDRSSNDGPSAPAASSFVTIDRTPAAATLTGPPSPTHATTPAWTVTFDEAISGFSAGDLTRSGTATGCKIATPIQTTATTWSVGASGCGTGTVLLNLKASSVLDLAGNVSPVGVVAAGSVFVDHGLPTTSVPTVRPRLHMAMSGSTIPVLASWSGADVGSGIVRYELQRKIDSGPWKKLSTSLTTPSMAMGLSSGVSIQLRVRAIDASGNAGTWVSGPTVTGGLVQQTSTAIHYAGSWTAATSSLYSGGSVLASSATSSSASYTFTGRGIGLISTLATTRGTVRVYLDGTYVTRVDMLTSPTMYQGIAWQTVWSSSHTHTIKLIVDGTAGRPRIDLDAIAVLH